MSVINDLISTTEESGIRVKRSTRNRKKAIRRFGSLLIFFSLAVGFVFFRNTSLFEQFTSRFSKSEPIPEDNRDDSVQSVLSYPIVRRDFSPVQVPVSEQTQTLVLDKSQYSVLIIHSCTEEAYFTGATSYDESTSFYSDTSNVQRIGEALVSSLEENQIKALHCTKNFAENSYYSGKEDYEKEIMKILQEYPSIQCIIDVSRDIIIESDRTMVAPSFALLRIKTDTEEAISFCSTFSCALRGLEKSPYSLFPDGNVLAFKLYVGSCANTEKEAEDAVSDFASAFSSSVTIK